MTRKPVLPDLLSPGLDVVFCGTAPGSASAAAGAYYAHPQNKFWPTLYRIGLTPRLLQPADFPLLLNFRIGLTDIAKQDFGQDQELPRESLGRAAVGRLKARIKACRPHILAFTSLTGGRRVLGSRASLGRQARGPENLACGSTSIFILPSPSPKAHWNWNEAPWQELADEIFLEREKRLCA